MTGHPGQEPAHPRRPASGQPGHGHRAADRSAAEIVAELRKLADSRRNPAITTLDNLMFDVLVHVQDIAVPLGLPAAMATRRCARGHLAGVADGLAVLGP